MKARLKEPFSISRGAQSAVENILVQVKTKNGISGWGEAAPMPSFNLETPKAVESSLKDRLPEIMGKPLSLWRKFECSSPGALAAVQTAMLDAWTQQLGIPLYVFFGGAQNALQSDITIPIVSSRKAFALAESYLLLGFKQLKIKVGKYPEEDISRVLAVHRAAPSCQLLLDANGGYDVSQTIKFLKKLKRMGISPALMEQPVPKEDLEGMAYLTRKAGTLVAADESLSSVQDAAKIIKRKAAGVLNLKLMKLGISGALEAALMGKAAGMKLMIGGLVETPLAMSAAAHLAAGLGGFSFVDLDTCLLFSKNPTRGFSPDKAGSYRLKTVRRGHGVRPGRLPPPVWTSSRS